MLKTFSLAEQWKMASTETVGALYWTTDKFAYNALKLLGKGNAIMTMPASGIQPVADSMGRQEAAVRLNSPNRNTMAWILLAKQYAQSGSSTGCFPLNSLCLLYPDAPSCKARGFTVTFWIKVLSVC